MVTGRWGTGILWGTGINWGAEGTDDLCEEAFRRLPARFRQDPVMRAIVCEIAQRMQAEKESLEETLALISPEGTNRFVLLILAGYGGVPVFGLNIDQIRYDIITKAMCDNYEGTIGDLIDIVGRYAVAGSTPLYEFVEPLGYRLTVQAQPGVESRLRFFWGQLRDDRRRELVVV